jgi:phage portal protein BeeE
LHKIASGANPTFNNVSALNQDYYSQTLQYYIESIESLLEDGLGLSSVRDVNYGIEFDIEGLLRMDPVGRAEANSKSIQAGYLTPNEARKRENLKPVIGGDTPYLQQQNYSLSALNKRDTAADPFAGPKPALPAPDPNAPPTPPAKSYEEQVIAALADMTDLVVSKFSELEYVS